MPIVRLVLAVFLMLWLPLQATAALVMGARVEHHTQHVGAQVIPIEEGSSQHRHHVGASSEAVCDEAAASDLHGAADAKSGADACNHCTLCAAPAAPGVTASAHARSPFVAASGVALHAPAAFAATPPGTIHRPPIATAA